MSRLFFYGFLVLSPILLACGCKDDGKDAPVVLVEGTVTLDGTPVDGVKVMFSPAKINEGETATGETDVEGKFKLTSINGKKNKGAVPAKYTVTLDKSEVKKLDTPIIEKSDGVEMKIWYVPTRLIPGKYSYQQTTPFKSMEVKSQGDNIFTFPMESDRK